ERGSIECRLDAASQSEAETIQIIVEKASIDALSSDGADETVALIIAIGANPTSGLSGDDDSRLPAMLRRLAETRQHALEPAGFPVFIVRTPIRPEGHHAVGDVVQEGLAKEPGLANDSSARFIDIHIEGVETGEQADNEIAGLFSRVLGTGLDY